MPEKSEIIEQLRKDFPRTWKAYFNSSEYNSANSIYHARYFFDMINIFISVENYPNHKISGLHFEFNGYRWRHQVFYNSVEYRIDSGFKSRTEAEIAAIQHAFQIAENEVVWFPPKKSAENELAINS